jgi:hypothetical protein
MASINSYQRKTKGNRPLKTNGLPSYSIPVENRIKRIKAELNKGLSKADSIWNNICNDIRLTT